MNTIITHFVEKCTENFNETLEKIFSENGTVTDLTVSLKKEFDRLGVEPVKYALESVDNE